jgi:prepilin-type N-terminal cleavage/methylation domain-containing protein
MMKFAKKTKAAKGFTLIELAIVIAIIAILASVAIPRFANMTDNANGALAQAYLSQLNTASATWMASNAATPTGFAQFVENATSVPAAATTTIALPKRPNSNLAACTLGGTITCAFGGTIGTVTYTLVGGQATCANSGTKKIC